MSTRNIEAVLAIRTLDGDVLELASDKETILRVGEIMARVRRGEDPRMLGHAWWFEAPNLSTTFPSTEEDMCTSTVTVSREDQDITVVSVRLFGSWYIAEALDENGGEIDLTPEECSNVLARMSVGEDDTGV